MELLTTLLMQSSPWSLMIVLGLLVLFCCGWLLKLLRFAFKFCLGLGLAVLILQLTSVALTEFQKHETKAAAKAAIYRAANAIDSNQIAEQLLALAKSSLISQQP